MVMKIPTIGTNWSGNTEFMNDKNSFLVPPSGMEPVGDNHNHFWASPSLVHLKQNLRQVFEDRFFSFSTREMILHSEEVSARTNFAREELITKYSLESVSDLIVKKLEVIAKSLPERREARRNQVT